MVGEEEDGEAKLAPSAVATLESFAKELNERCTAVDAIGSKQTLIFSDTECGHLTSKWLIENARWKTTPTFEPNLNCTILDFHLGHAQPGSQVIVILPRKTCRQCT